MTKVDFIAKYGEAAYEKLLAQIQDWRKAHREEYEATVRKWKENHPAEVAECSHEQNRRGGKYYDKKKEYQRTGIAGEKNRIRDKHGRQYKLYKNIIAPDSQIHHEWIPNTSDYRGIALVEKDAHMHGFVDVIEILDGEITLLTEEQIRNGGV